TPQQPNPTVEVSCGTWRCLCSPCPAHRRHDGEDNIQEIQATDAEIIQQMLAGVIRSRGTSQVWAIISATILNVSRVQAVRSSHVQHHIEASRRKCQKCFAHSIFPPTEASLIGCAPDAPCCAPPRCRFLGKAEQCTYRACEEGGGSETLHTAAEKYRSFAHGQ